MDNINRPFHKKKIKCTDFIGLPHQLRTTTLDTSRNGLVEKVLVPIYYNMTCLSITLYL